MLKQEVATDMKDLYRHGLSISYFANAGALIEHLVEAKRQDRKQGIIPQILEK